MHRQVFNTENFYILPTQYICIFCRVSEQAAIISLYNLDRLVSIFDTEHVIAFLFRRGAVDYFVQQALETESVAHPTSCSTGICGKVARG